MLSLPSADLSHHLSLCAELVQYHLYCSSLSYEMLESIDLWTAFDVTFILRCPFWVWWSNAILPKVLKYPQKIAKKVETNFQRLEEKKTLLTCSVTKSTPRRQWRLRASDSFTGWTTSSIASIPDRTVSQFWLNELHKQFHRWVYIERMLRWRRIGVAFSFREREPLSLLNVNANFSISLWNPLLNMDKTASFRSFTVNSGHSSALPCWECLHDFLSLECFHSTGW